MEKISIIELLKLGKENNKSILMILCGCSGSGKSTFENKLINMYPEFFYKLPQVTTRQQRKNESDKSYYFINDESYTYMKDCLVGRLSNFGGSKYGTIPVFRTDRINTIIASYEAIDDIFDLMDKNQINIIPCIIKFDIDYSSLSEDGKRKHRDEDFIKMEKENLNKVYNKYKDKCHKVYSYNFEDNNDYAKVSDIFYI